MPTLIINMLSDHDASKRDKVSVVKENNEYRFLHLNRVCQLIQSKSENSLRLHTHTSSEVLLIDCTDEDGILFLLSVANEGTVAATDNA